MWTMGLALECPKYQNVAIQELFERDSEDEAELKCDGMKKSEMFSFIASKHLSYLDGIGAKHKANGTFHDNKLLSYIIDKLVWDAMKGGFTWLNVVHKGTCLANIVARACFDAAKKPRPPKFAPWHIFNHQKYLLNVEPVPVELIENQGDPAIAEGSKRKRAFIE
jgi:hypothetical protein